ncbi:hypothetical protein CYPRO_2350 [Cyclonatronum proteinivorum]|uniref:Uncharacterized protein n=1 Tax=Cyclonatronum proteinivorum TaxID=1457365 RepID=A0A345UM90_9BACT|nr:hypothetical protein [Cyclonatronum proteinivorum]AXJ01592.1 hypothetical protein CYPRO_2350 [Cyclonatronum proteinivorum]
MEEEPPHLSAKQTAFLRRILRDTGSPKEESLQRVAEYIRFIQQAEAQEADPQAPPVAPDRALLLERIKKALIQSGQYPGSSTSETPGD